MFYFIMPFLHAGGLSETALLFSPLKLFDECSQVSFSMNQASFVLMSLCCKKSQSFAAQHIFKTANSRLDTVRKVSITARTGFERFTVRSRNPHDLGSKEYLLGLETGTIWARKRHQLNSKQACF